MATQVTTGLLANDAVTDAKLSDTITATTQSASDNTTKVATTAYVTTAIANLADSAPSTLNTLNELAAALGDDANFSTTVTNSIATKLPLAGGTLTGALTTNGVINTGTSHNFAINTPNSVRINIDSNDSATDQVFVIGKNQTGVDASNDVLFKVGEDGKVGIGTGAPGNVLHVHQTDAGSNSYVHITQADGGSANTDGLSIGIEDGGVNAVIRNRESGYLRMYTNNLERARIHANGKASFSANGIGDVTSVPRDFAFYTEGSTNGMEIRSNDQRLLFFGAGGSGGTGSDDGYLAMSSQGNGKIALNANGVSYINGGNVGIGNASPTIGKLVVEGGGGSGFSTLHLQADTSTQFNHSVNAFNSNLTNGENNLIVIGRAGSTRNSAWMGYKWYSDASYSNCLTFGHWGNNNIVNLNGYGILMGGSLETAPNYPGAITTARTGSSSTTTQGTWGFNSTASGSHKDFGYKASGTGSYAYGVLNAAETAWMSRLDFGGAIHLTNTTVQNISDRRLKKNIVDANSQWDDIKALQFKNFKWKDEARGTDTYLGLIADEVESVSPGLVGIDAISAETMPDDGIDPEYKNVKYSIVWMKAVKALQEAMAKIETLEAKVKALEEG
mgnify:CR=1 FL=1|tara:strand:+ start:15 stop:1862 length:1848 start_codon:yes stop_codon:yes gene_type:complete